LAIVSDGHRYLVRLIWVMIYVAMVRWLPAYIVPVPTKRIGCWFPGATVMRRVGDSGDGHCIARILGRDVIVLSAFTVVWERL